MKIARPHIFFGWQVVAAGAAILFGIQGARSIFGVVLKPIAAEMLWSRSAVSAAAMLNLCVFALTLTLVGRLYDRYGAKWVVAGATLSLAAGFIGLAFAQSYGQFLILYGIFAAFGFGGASIPLFAALASRWFHRHRGLAISVTLTGGCLGQYVVVPLSAELVSRYGWRAAFIVIAVAVLAVNLTLAATCIESDPAKLGLRPYGQPDGALQGHRPGAPAASAPGPKDATLAQAARTSPFWFYLLLMIVCGGGDFLFLTHLIPMVTDNGIAPEIAGHMLGLAGLFSLIGILLAGPISDRIGNKIPLVITFALRAAIFIVVMHWQSVPAFYLFALGFGFTMLITAPITTTLMGKLYGFTHVGLITGFVTTLHHLSGGVWAYLGGVIFDRSGGYEAAFFFSALLALLAVGCALAIQEKHRSTAA